MTNPDPATPVPTVTTTPRLGRGVRWSDMVRDIELDELERQTRNNIEPASA